MPDLAYVNGDILPIEAATVPIEDRGYQFGDGVYEVVASYNGRLFMRDAHLERLERSLSELGYDPIDRTPLQGAMEDLLARSGYPRAAVYIQVSRGVAPRNHAIAAHLAPQIVMTVRAVNEVPQSLRTTGARAITVTDTRWGRCDIKTIQLLANSLAKQKALESGCDDAIFVSADEIVREGTSSNLFVVSGCRLITHPLTDNILGGITRMVVMELCKVNDLVVDETFFSIKELLAADEVFLSGTITEILPVVRVDGQSIGNGKVGPIARRLYALLREKAQA